MTSIQYSNLVIGRTIFYCFFQKDQSESTYRFNLSSSDASNSTPQPTSTRIWIPPSSSMRDCEASELECEPSNGVKLNIPAEESTGRNWRSSALKLPFHQGSLVFAAAFCCNLVEQMGKTFEGLSTRSRLWIIESPSVVTLVCRLPKPFGLR